MNRTIPALTGLRFFAALAVYFFHFGAGWSQRVGFPHAFTSLMNNGFMGVSIFFILSGFVLSYSHRDKIVDWRNVAGFYVARVARIYPMYLIALAVAFPLVTHLSGETMASVLLMVQSWGPARSDTGYSWVMQAWTLSVEAAFYISFPVLFVIIRRMTVAYAAIGAIVVSAFMVVFTLPTIGPAATGHHGLADLLLELPLPLLRVAEFIYGMLLCQIFFAAPRWHQTPLTSSVAVSANLLVIVGLLARPFNAYWLSLAAVFFGLLIYQLAAGRMWLSSLLSKKWALILGGSSYAIYLLQGPVRAWMSVVAPNFGAAINPIVLIVSSIFAYRWIEEPARRFVMDTADSLFGQRTAPRSNTVADR